MPHRIVWRPAARDDLLALYDWIAAQAGGDTAFRYTSAIESHLALLTDYPASGNARDDLAPGVRTLSYRRRTVIAYRIDAGQVEILRLAHGGRDLGLMFADDD